MPDYKKKRVNRFRSAPKRIKKSRLEHDSKADNIVMTPLNSRKKNSEPKSNMRVVKGKKLEQRRRLKLFASVAAFVIVICVILQLILPVGIIENVQNLTSLIGTGSYPLNLESSETLNSVSRGSYYYVLTDTRINAFSNSGKIIYSHAHGFENPVLKTSKTRALIFDQGKNEFMIYNLKKLKRSSVTKSEIITVGISDSGTYAIVTKSDKYASTVSVYNKFDKLIYEWYSSEDTVNNVAVSPNGKKIAVSTFNAVSGQYTSKINVLTYDSANPVFSQTLDGTIVYNLDTTHNSGFSVLSSNKFEFIKWSKFSNSEYKNDYSLAMFRAGSGGIVNVFNRESDRTDNKVVVFNSSGELKNEFGFKGIISDIQIFNGHIYCISDTDVYLLDKDGSVLRKAECGFGAVKLAVTSTNTVAVITDNQINKIKLEQE